MSEWNHAVGALLLVACGVVGAEAVDEEPRERLAQALRSISDLYLEQLREAQVVGSQVWVMKDGEVVFRMRHGLADRARNVPVDDDTIFHWASITKTLTAIGILQLRDRERLRLDDPVVDYLPELRAIHDPNGWLPRVTIRHLLTHSSGFRGPTWPWKSEEWQPHEPRSWEQLVAMLPYTRLHFEPGSRYGYSNPAFIFLGRILEILTGDDYEVYIDKNIFKPLGMHRSYFDATPYHLLPHRSASYWIRDGRAVAARFDVDTGITVANGGLNAPFGDLAKYVDFLVGHPERVARHEAVLERASLDEMWRPELEREGRADEGDRDRRDEMGLGFFLEHNHGRRYVGHSGGQNAFVTHFYAQPESRSAYVIAYNTRTDSSIEQRDHVPDRTSVIDGRIKNALFERIFPLLDGR